MNDLSQKEWANKLSQDEQAIILDVRTAEECAQGIIPNAICADIKDSSAFMARVNNMDKSKNYYIYCRSGARSAMACQLLNQEGFTCYNLLGGMMQWQGEVARI